MATVGETHYEVLGVASTADADAIRAAYLRLVSRYHPDRHEGNPLSELAEEKLAAVNVAYEVLSDPVRRAVYDAQGVAGRPVRPLAVARGVPPGLKLALRVLGGFVAVVLLLPMSWRLLRVTLAPLSGTPAVPLAVLGLVAVVVILSVRRRRRRHTQARPAAGAKPD